MKHILALLVILILLSACNTIDPIEPTQEPIEESIEEPAEEPEQVPQPQVMEVTLQTKDGVIIAGTFFDAPDNDMAVILVHMINRDRNDWTPFANELLDRGFDVLSIDLRGHGQSVQSMQGMVLDWKKFSEKGFQESTRDIAAAKEFLKSKGSNIFLIIGASIGANLALNSAIEDPVGVMGLVLLSPGLNYRGVDTETAISAYGSRPIFIIASEDDPQSAAASKTLATFSKGDLHLFKTAGHGTNMFTEPELSNLIHNWISDNFVFS